MLKKYRRLNKMNIYTIRKKNDATTFNIQSSVCYLIHFEFTVIMYIDFIRVL